MDLGNLLILIILRITIKKISPNPTGVGIRASTNLSINLRVEEQIHYDDSNMFRRVG